MGSSSQQTGISFRTANVSRKYGSSSSELATVQKNLGEGSNLRKQGTRKEGKKANKKHMTHGDTFSQGPRSWLRRLFEGGGLVLFSKGVSPQSERRCERPLGKVGLIFK